MLGQHAKAYDLELREPTPGAVVVQVKSRATLADLKARSRTSPRKTTSRVFLVVANEGPRSGFRPSRACRAGTSGTAGDLVIDAGLVTWLEEKVS